jgi:hypothetical protein
MKAEQEARDAESAERAAQEAATMQPIAVFEYGRLGESWPAGV